MVTFNSFLNNMYSDNFALLSSFKLNYYCILMICIKKYASDGDYIN